MWHKRKEMQPLKSTDSAVTRGNFDRIYIKVFLFGASGFSFGSFASSQLVFSFTYFIRKISF